MMIMTTWFEYSNRQRWTTVELERGRGWQPASVSYKAAESKRGPRDLVVGEWLEAVDAGSLGTGASEDASRAID